MEGEFIMLTPKGEEFRAGIGRFYLAARVDEPAADA
jgi:hypothetical protein